MFFRFLAMLFPLFLAALGHTSWSVRLERAENAKSALEQKELRSWEAFQEQAWRNLDNWQPITAAVESETRFNKRGSNVMKLSPKVLGKMGDLHYHSGSYLQAGLRGGLQAGGATSEVHFSEECFLGAGYDVWKRNCGDQGLPIAMPEECNDSHASNANCWESEYYGASGWSFYNQKVETKDDMSSMMSTAMTAEGSGWGVSISASAAYMQQHATTSNTVGFWIGQSGDTHTTTFRNPTLLALNRQASKMLAANWTAFIDAYGSHYVQRVIYSTRFIGSAQISSRSETSSSSLSVAASMSYEGMFSASGSAEYNTATKGEHGELRTKVQAYYLGKLTEYSDSEKTAVQQLQDTYEKWNTNVISDPQGNSVETKLVYRSWYDLAQVQEILGNYPQNEWEAINNAFKAGLPTETTLKTLSEEYIWTGTEINTLSMFMNYQCVKNNKALHAKVSDYKDKLTSHRVEMENLSADEIFKIQQNIIAGDFSWFVGRSLEYSRDIQGMLKDCPDDICSCNHPMTDDIQNDNSITCTQSGKKQCEAFEKCVGGPIGNRPYQELCQQDTCYCASPNNSNNNRIKCEAHPDPFCPNGHPCITSEISHWGNWDKLCGKNLCKCEAPGDKNNNAIKCTLTGKRYCNNGVRCTSTKTVDYGQEGWDILCGGY